MLGSACNDLVSMSANDVDGLRTFSVNGLMDRWISREVIGFGFSDRRPDVSLTFLE